MNTLVNYVFYDIKIKQCSMNSSNNNNKFLNECFSLSVKQFFLVCLFKILQIQILKIKLKQRFFFDCFFFFFKPDKKSKIKIFLFHSFSYLWSS